MKSIKKDHLMIILILLLVIFISFIIYYYLYNDIKQNFNLPFQRLPGGLGYLHPFGLPISNIPDAEPLDLLQADGACERLHILN